MPENHTIPDPHLTREEAERLLSCSSYAATAYHEPGPDCMLCGVEKKLRNSLSAPLVEDGGVEEAVEVLAKRLFGLFAGRECAFEECDWSIRQHWLSETRSLLAAIQPFLGQGEQATDGAAEGGAKALTLEQKAMAEIEGAAAGACPYCEGGMDSFGGVHRKDCPMLARPILKASPQVSTQQHKEEEKV